MQTDGATTDEGASGQQKCDVPTESKDGGADTSEGTQRAVEPMENKESASAFAGIEKTEVAGKTEEAPKNTTASNDGVGAKKGDDGDAERSEQEQHWRDMADGIAMLFDEALPSNLLYREEWPQFRVLEELPDLFLKPPSEIYGCEHLLRLFVRLPEVLADSMSDDEARPILAKVNDFVRFLHKNQGTLLTQSHRKLNEAELKEQRRLAKKEEKKRSRLSVAEGSENQQPAKKIRSDKANMAVKPSGENGATNLAVKPSLTETAAKVVVTQ
jgi:hypothetical protein